VIGLDLGLKGDRTVAAVCHAKRLRNERDETTGQTFVLDRMQAWTGSRADPVQLQAIEEWLVEAGLQILLRGGPEGPRVVGGVETSRSLRASPPPLVVACRRDLTRI
jgi:hypothetical protein